MAQRLQIGQLNRRVTIQQRSAVIGDFGQQSTYWSDVCTVWAHVAPLTGRELVNAQARFSEVTYRVTILYRKGITAAMRVLFEDLTLNVGAVIDPDTEHVSLQLLCSEGLNEG